jgi:hypothetical protein
MNRVSPFSTKDRTLSGFYYWKARLAYACFLDAEDDFPRDREYREEMLAESAYYQMIGRKLYNEERVLYDHRN